jgi:hypothetical protein
MVKQDRSTQASSVRVYVKPPVIQCPMMQRFERNRLPTPCGFFSDISNHSVDQCHCEHLGAWFIANLDVIAGEAKVARRPGETLALAAMAIFAAQGASS